MATNSDGNSDESAVGFENDGDRGRARRGDASEGGDAVIKKKC